MLSYIVKVNEELQRDPFRVLLLESLAKSPNDSLQDKSLLLTQLETQLKDLEISHEATGAKNHWLTITSGFSSALAIAGMSAITPPFGWMFGGLAVVSAITTLGSTQKTKAASSPIIETLKRHRLALDSQEALQWAVLWTYAGVDLFCFALNQASQGYVSGNGQLLRRDGDSPFSAAISYLARCQGIKYETLVATLTQLKDGSPVLPTQVTLPSAIGEDTKLNAIEVESSPVSVSAPQVSVIPTAQVSVIPTAQAMNNRTEINFRTTQTKTLYSPIDALVPDDGDVKSALVIGVPGVGKGVVFSNMAKKLKVTRPDLKLVGIDPKCDSKEAGNWHDFDEVYARDTLYDSDEVKAEWFFACLEDFKTKYREKAVLVVDELTVLTQAFSCKKIYQQVFSGFITAVTSQGDSRGLFLIGVGQIAHGESLGLNGGLRSLPISIGLIGGSNVAAIRSMLATSFVKTISSLDLDALRAQSPRGRAWYDGRTDSWYSMPELPILCGYDRDKRAMVQTQDTKTDLEVKKSDSKILAKFEKDLTEQLKIFQAQGKDITRINLANVAKRVPDLSIEEVETVLNSVLNKLTQKVGV